MFEENVERYDSWFERHKYVYLSELNAVKLLLPKGLCVEVGVGTGRFASPLGVKFGVEPSRRMAEVAKRRGVEVVLGVAESLPFRDNCFDCVLIVTTICFVDDPEETLREAYRVLKPGGALVIGFIDRESPIGKEYEKKRGESVFYRVAKFFSTKELVNLLEKTNFEVDKILQTLFRKLNEINSVEPVEEGWGKGSFVVVRALKPRKAT